jgi:hypothetical protein
MSDNLIRIYAQFKNTIDRNEAIDKINEFAEIEEIKDTKKYALWFDVLLYLDEEFDNEKGIDKISEIFHEYQLKDNADLIVYRWKSTRSLLDGTTFRKKE